MIPHTYGAHMSGNVGATVTYTHTYRHVVILFFTFFYFFLTFFSAHIHLHLPTLPTRREWYDLPHIVRVATHCETV